MQYVTSCLLLLLLIIFPVVPAAAQVVNLNPITIGDRAFGLGGAFTAFASDATAGWYNPAGLGFIDRTYINATGNVYSYEHARAENFVVLEPTTGTGGSATLDEKQIQATPSTFSLAKSLGSRGTVGFGVYVPRDINVEDSFAIAANYDSQLLGPTHEDFYERDSYSERSIYLGPGYGYRLNDYISIGASAFILYSITDLDMLQNITLTATDNTGSETGIAKEKVTYWGTRFLLGTKAKFGGLHIGVSAFTPTVRISETTDSTSIESGFFGAGSPVNSVSSGKTSNTGRGWEVAAGVGWEEKDSWATELDVTYYIPEFRRDIAARNVTNVKVGGEYNLTPNYRLRAGFFTDFSPWHGTLDTSDRPYDIDIYGFTLQLENHDYFPNSKIMRSFSIGVRYAFGNGSVLGTLNNPTTNDISTPRRDLDYQSIAIMLGGTLAY